MKMLYLHVELVKSYQHTNIENIHKTHSTYL